MANTSKHDEILKQVNTYIEPYGGPATGLYSVDLTLVANARTELFMRMMRDAGGNYMWKVTKDGKHAFLGYPIIVDDAVPDWKVHMRRRYAERWS